MELAAQIVGFCGTAGLFISYQQNTKNRILLFQILGITMFTLHFFLLSAWSGCMMNLLGIGRALLYAYTEQKGLHVRWLCPLLCAVFTAAAVLDMGERVFAAADGGDAAVHARLRAEAAPPVPPPDVPLLAAVDGLQHPLRLGFPAW